MCAGTVVGEWVCICVCLNTSTVSFCPHMQIVWDPEKKKWINKEAGEEVQPSSSSDVMYIQHDSPYLPCVPILAEHGCSPSPAHRHAVTEHAAAAAAICNDASGGRHEWPGSS